jgi:diguanylate cyclase (GGDEF)-like protein
VLLNDLAADPSRLLATELASVTATERTVRATAFVLIPLGLGGVAACGWLLSLYRRRSEATMRAALITTTEEARTDELTGLPNRRALLEELKSRSDANEPFTLTLADLNGFKRYNDTFGHPAGDALLRRLGRRLAERCEPHAMVARLGGDEFCALFSAETPADEAHALVTEALTDTGEGFCITASAGAAAAPIEARDPSALLRLADSRMYAAKAAMQPDAHHGMTTTLTRMLDARHPGLASHVEQVARLAVACAEALGLAADDVRMVEHAARLHDVGKVAVPSEILTKRGRLSEEEWEFMRRHTLIGERILGGSRTFERAASLVRSSHERWDGRGYPDGLAGQQIPIGARIVFVADAFCAMTEERPYADAQSVQAACRELRVCAGTQFDPAVVDALLARSTAAARPRPGLRQRSRPEVAQHVSPAPLRRSAAQAAHHRDPMGRRRSRSPLEPHRAVRHLPSRRNRPRTRRTTPIKRPTRAKRAGREWRRQRRDRPASSPRGRQSTLPPRAFPYAQAPKYRKPALRVPYQRIVARSRQQRNGGSGQH